MQDKLSVLQIGSRVKLKLRGEVEGTIVGVMIEAGPSIAYGVAYWNGHHVELEWFPASLVSDSRPEQVVNIGFQ